jgi:hypothetical protein
LAHHRTRPIDPTDKANWIDEIRKHNDSATAHVAIRGTRVELE